MSLLFDALFSAVALSHFGVDLLNGQRAVILTYLSVPLGLNNTALGFISTIYIAAGSLFQPVFGYVADRIGARWVISGGVIWMALFYSLALVSTGSLGIWLFVLASIGSAAFHPAGTMQATLLGRSHLSGRETTSAGYFFVFGQMGGFFGPIIAGPILDRTGLSGLGWIPIVIALIGVNAFVRLRATTTKSIPTIIPSTPPNSNEKRTGILILAFVLVAAFQALAQQNIATFLPKYLHDLGQSASTYSLIAALFMGGSAIGSGLGGQLADRFGKQRVASASLALAAIPLFIVGNVGWSPLLYFAVPVAGALTGAVHSILVVLAQRALPGGMATASGLILGFLFISGALGTLFCGYLADKVGFPPVFQLSAFLILIASALALTLQKN
jgi:FSR family fosmidomycin resistance protein-like MFS transporter